MKKSKSKFYMKPKPVRKFAEGGSFKMTDENAESNKFFDDTGQGVASAFGPWWGALAGAGTETSKSIKGSGSSQLKNQESVLADPFNQFKNNESTGDWIGSFANPFGSALVKGKRMKEDYDKQLRQYNNDRVSDNALFSNKINNSVPSYSAVPYGSKGMKLKSKFYKAC